MNIFKTTLFCLLLISTQMLFAQHPRHFWQDHLLAQNQGIGAGEAAARVQKKLGGRILSVETFQRKGKTFHRIKVLTRKGIVRIIRVNAENGRFR